MLYRVSTSISNDNICGGTLIESDLIEWILIPLGSGPLIQQSFVQPKIRAAFYGWKKLEG
jgi:hypothetical protein